MITYGAALVAGPGTLFGIEGGALTHGTAALYSSRDGLLLLAPERKRLEPPQPTCSCQSYGSPESRDVLM